HRIKTLASLSIYLPPVKGMRITMAGYFYIRQLKNLARPHFQHWTKFWKSACRTDLPFNDRDGHRDWIFAQDAIVQHLRAELMRGSGKLGLGYKAITIHLCKQQATPVFRGHIGDRHLWQLQGTPEKL